MRVIVLLVLSAWAMAGLLAVSLCAAAAGGDRGFAEPIPSTPPVPDWIATVAETTDAAPARPAVAPDRLTTPVA